MYKRRQIGKPTWLVGEASVRPAGKPDECFYCNRKLGEEHKPDCVIRSRTVVVKFSIEVVVSVPEVWTPERVSGYYGKGGTWCADNLLRYLDGRNQNTGHCLCGITDAEYVREATSEDEEKYGDCFIEDEES